MRPLLASALLLLTSCVGAASSNGSFAPDPETRQELLAFVDDLYAAFSFGGGAEPDWDRQRELYAPGATFVRPQSIGDSPVVEGTEPFLEGFRRYVLAGPYSESGLHERVLDVRMDVAGSVAQLLVTFEGHLPGSQERETLGVDSLVLIAGPRGWQLVSFATHYQ